MSADRSESAETQALRLAKTDIQNGHRFRATGDANAEVVEKAEKEEDASTEVEELKATARANYERALKHFTRAVDRSKSIRPLSPAATETLIEA